MNFRGEYRSLVEQYSKEKSFTLCGLRMPGPAQPVLRLARGTSVPLRDLHNRLQAFVEERMLQADVEEPLIGPVHGDA